MRQTGIGNQRMPGLPTSVLITRHDKIGDFVLALPLCKAIKTQYPQIRLSMLVAPVNAEIARALPFVDDVVVYFRDQPGAALKALRALQPDVSISCFIDTHLGWLLFRAGITRRIGPATKLAQIFFNRRIVQRRSRVEMPEYAYNLELGRAIFPDLDSSFTPPLFQFPDVSAPSTKRVVFHPGFGGSSDGNLRIEDYLALAKRASQLAGVEVLFTFGPDDAATRQAVAASLDFPARLVDSFPSLRAFCEYLQGCTLFVSTSTGPMHLAGAVNTPTLSFFGDSLFASSARWQPLNEPARQRNFMLARDYDHATYATIEAALLEALA